MPTTAESIRAFVEENVRAVHPGAGQGIAEPLEVVQEKLVNRFLAMMQRVAEEMLDMTKAERRAIVMQLGNARYAEGARCRSKQK